MIKGTVLTRTVLHLLDENVVSRLLKEKDWNGDDVYDGSLRRGLQSRYAYNAQRWLVIAEYRDNLQYK